MDTDTHLYIAILPGDEVEGRTKETKDSVNLSKIRTVAK